MFELKEHGYWHTPETDAELNKMLSELGADGLHGAMFMHNFIAKQYQENKLLPREEEKNA
jgi:hypothetical protein